jgi:hypothetical protein
MVVRGESAARVSDRERRNGVAWNLTFPRSLEKESHYKHLQSCHCYHHQALNDAEIEDSPFSTPDRTEVPVLTRSEVFLVTADGR